MKFNLVTSKLRRHGYYLSRDKFSDSIDNNFTAYIAVKDEKWIKLYCKYDDRIYKWVVQEFSYRIDDVVGTTHSMVDLLRKLGEVPNRSPKPKAGDISTTAGRRKFLLNFMKTSNISNQEILDLNIITGQSTRNLVLEVFPGCFRIPKRDSITSSRKRQRFENIASNLWRASVKVFLAHDGNKAIYRVKVDTKVEPPTDLKCNYYENKTVGGDVPVFAVNAKEAIGLVKAMTSEFANCDSLGIVAIGNPQEAMKAYNESHIYTASSALKYEITSAQNALIDAQNTLIQAQLRLDYFRKKIEIASFLDSFRSMADMMNIDHMGI